MNKYVFSAIIAFAATTVSAQNFPSPSPLAKVSQVVGLTEIEVEYSRPAVNGRVIFGDLVPLGQIWRTGANSATKVTFEDDVNFAGKEVKAGTYALFTVPDDGGIKIMLNSNADQGGTGRYDNSLDVAEAKVPFTKVETKVERMRFTFENMTNKSADLVFAWDNMTFSVPIIVNSDAKAEANLKAKMAEFDGQYSFYNEAAAYYLAEGKDPNQALEWAQKSVEMSPKFWNTHTLAKAYKAVGDNAGAMSAAEKSMQLARDAEYMPYIKMNEEFIADIKKNGTKKK
jgi:hypothetical protein